MKERKMNRDFPPPNKRMSDVIHPDLIDAVSVTRFWRNVEIGDPDQCWKWKGDKDRDGYGIFTFNGSRKPAHELALSFTTGEKRSENLDTCHACDNPECCNPHHLRFDTRLSNVNDMISRGRNHKGEAASKYGLTENDVMVIRLRRSNGARLKDLAQDFGVGLPCINAITLGNTWKHVGGPITTRKNQRKVS